MNSIKMISEITNKSEELFVANIHPTNVEEIRRIEKVNVSTRAKSVDWLCTGIQELKNELTLENEHKHYYRIVLALQDLNRLKKLDKQPSQILRKFFEELRGSRISYAHCI